MREREMQESGEEMRDVAWDRAENRDSFIHEIASARNISDILLRVNFDLGISLAEPSNYSPLPPFRVYNTSVGSPFPTYLRRNWLRTIPLYLHAGWLAITCTN